MSRPTTLGGTISVSDETALAELDPDGLPLGSSVYVTEDKAAFQLLVSGRPIVVEVTDDVVELTKTWTFANGNFRQTDVGASFTIAGAVDEDNNGTFEIATVVDSATVTTVEAPGGDETFDTPGVTCVLADAPVDEGSVVEVFGLSGVRWFLYAVSNANHAATADLADEATAPADATAFTADLNVATTSLKGLESAEDKTKLDALVRPIRGANLTDADITRQPWSDKVAEYVLPAATLTTGRALTLGVNGSPQTSFKVRVIRQDRTANAYAVINGGIGAGTLISFAASPTTDQAAEFFFDGTNFLLVGFYPVTTS